MSHTSTVVAEIVSSANASAAPAPTESLSIATTVATKIVSCSRVRARAWARVRLRARARARARIRAKIVSCSRAMPATTTAPVTPLESYAQERGAMTWVKGEGLNSGL